MYISYLTEYYTNHNRRIQNRIQRCIQNREQIRGDADYYLRRSEELYNRYNKYNNINTEESFLKFISFSHITIRYIKIYKFIIKIKYTIEYKYAYISHRKL